MNTRTYDLVTCTCAVSAENSVHAIMHHYLNAFPVPTSADLDVDVELTLHEDPAAVAAATRSWDGAPPTDIRNSHPDQRYRTWALGDRRTLLPESGHDHVITVAGRHIAVTADRVHVAATIGVRIVRQLIMRAGEARGGRALHTGAVAVDGAGVLVAGHPGAGKTSVLTRLIDDHYATAVSNDRTVLVPTGDGVWRAVAVPLAWRFTPESIGGAPRLAAALTRRAPFRGSTLTDGKVELTPGEISHIFHSPPRSTVQIARAVVLLRSPTTQPARPDAAFLRDHMGFGTADFFAEDWLGIRSQLPGHTQPPTALDAWWNAVATLPVQVITWADPTELKQVAATVVAGEQ